MAFNNVALYADVAQRVRHRVIDALAEATPIYPQFCMTVQSDTDSEDYDWLGSFPGMREWLGDRKFEQLSSFEFSIKNREWESGIRLPKQKIDDGKTGYFNNLADGLAREAAYHPDELLIEVVDAGESTECFDGQYFFDTDHVSDQSGTQSNLLTKDIVDPAAPTEAEAREAVQEAVIKMMGYKRDNGKPYYRPRAQMLSDLLITCPLALFPTFDKAFHQVVTEDNGAGVSNYNMVKPAIMPLTTMTGNKFDLYNLGETLKPYVFQDRRPLSTGTKHENDREFRDILVMADARYNIGYLAWWTAVRTKFI